MHVANDNTPLRVGEWITQRVGGSWYTAKLPARIMMHDRIFLSPKAYAALEDEFRRATGREPYAPIPATH